MGGVDTHADTIHVAAVDSWGRQLGDQEFPTTPSGYRQALAFLTGRGEVVGIGIEGTSSYGVGITRAAGEAGIAVFEVVRPERAVRRREGKSDPLDAYQAAQAMLSGRATAAAKSADITALRALHNARRSAVKARAAAQVQIRHQLVTSPADLREKYRNLTAARLIQTLAACRPSVHPDLEERLVLTALKSLARRHQSLTREISELDTELTTMIERAAPHLLHLHGVGNTTAAQLLITAGGNPDRLRSEASFAALCGTAPVPASSGKTTRHRLSRGGDRRANNALHTIAMARLRNHPPTKAFVQRQRDRGRSTPEILRLLKRAIAREMFKQLTRPHEDLGVHDLRPTRQAKNITLAAAAHALGLATITISRTERGLHITPEVVNRYREWLNTA
ncbi:putative IS110 family transposase [Janibacter sp. HTCC2649]|nr:putative IS110 family transposase [Janibacter sp. HTCC2649]EAP97863.1 putative IS110 family transposase [Janibacter sp. HTCC2649]EAP99549.1 putative IS110 family transposase [Janibacter sp. HTCC2649]